MFQDHRQHCGENLRVRLVARFAREHHWLGIIVNGVCVLIGQAIQQPCAHRLRIARILRAVYVLPIAQAIPLIVFHHARIERRLARAVLLQQFMRLRRQQRRFCAGIPCSLRLLIRARARGFLRRQNHSLFRQRLLRILRAHLLRISHVSLHFAPPCQKAHAIMISS